jgi:hypothetical protein
MKHIPYDEPQRVESGAVQFGEDWPGLFLRGDNAFAIAMEIGQLEAYFRVMAPPPPECAFMMSRLSSLRQTILKDVVKNGPDS